MHSSTLLSLLFLLTPIWAWGGLGHRTVAYLASKYFTDATSHMVATLLANDHGWDLSDGATWPDKGIQRRRPETAQWHYIDARDNPPEYCGLAWPRDCAKDGVPGCVVSAIAAQTAVLMSENATAREETEALMFVMHFLGDVHQPLHTELLERGGNGIPTCFAGSCGGHVNLHSVWDSLIALKSRGLLDHDGRISEEDEKRAAQVWAQELYETQSRKNATAWMAECAELDEAESCAMQWASESNAFVCSYVLAPGRAWIEANDLAGEYFVGAEPIVEHMVTTGGLRLARWLNTLADYRKEMGLDNAFRDKEAPADVVLEL